MGGRGSGGGGKGGKAGGGGSSSAPAVTAASSAQDIAESISRHVDEYTISSSLRSAPERQAAGEAAIRQTLEGMPVSKLRQVANAYNMSGKRPPAGTKSAGFVDWMMGQWRQSRGQWSLQ